MHQNLNQYFDYVYVIVGGYLPSDGSPYICSFMRTGFVVTMVIMGIWYIFGIGAGLALLVITFICKENKLVH